MFDIRKKIPKEELENLIFIQSEYEKCGYKLFLVGGAIRDALLGITIKDFDLATEAPLEVTKEIFKNVLPTGEEFGTLTLMLNGCEYEITRFRKDLDTDGRRATAITFAKTIQEDLSRRDMTINGMAYDVINDVLIDLYNGVDDLNSKQLRFIGNTKDRILEDHLRSIRFYRFLHRYPDFTTPKSTNDILSVVTKLEVVSMERIFQELDKMLGYDLDVKEMVIDGLLDIKIIEKFGLKINREENKKMLEEVFKTRSIIPILLKKYVESNFNSKYTLSSLKLPSYKFRNLFLAFNEIQNNDKIKNHKTFSLKSTMRFLNDKDEIKILFDFLGIKFYDELYDEFSGSPLSIKDLDINGNDLCKLGFQGKNIGFELNKLLLFVWKNPNSNIKELLISNLSCKPALNNKFVKLQK